MKASHDEGSTAIIGEAERYQDSGVYLVCNAA